MLRGSTEIVVDMTLVIINPCVPFRMWLLPHTAQQSGKCFACKYEARLKPAKSIETVKEAHACPPPSPSPLEKNFYVMKVTNIE